VQDDHSKSFVVTVIPSTPAARTTVGDILIGSFALAGVLLVLALMLGVGVALVRVLWIRAHPPEHDHLPPVSPYANGPVEPRSPQAR
jgi:hypothetical protein